MITFQQLRNPSLGYIESKLPFHHCCFIKHFWELWVPTSCHSELNVSRPPPAGINRSFYPRNHVVQQTLFSNTSHLRRCGCQDGCLTAWYHTESHRDESPMMQRHTSQVFIWQWMQGDWCHHGQQKVWSFYKMYFSVHNRYFKPKHGYFLMLMKCFLCKN